jgi:hypothetical protein
VPEAAIEQPAPEEVREAVPPERRGQPPRERRPSDTGPLDRPAGRRPRSRELLHRALSSPGAARQAFLLREVLGPPVSLRPGPLDRPS